MTRKQLDELIHAAVRMLAYGVNAKENSEVIEKYYTAKEQLISKLVELGFTDDGKNTN